MTINELNILIEEYTDSKNEEFKSRLTIAYYGAIFQGNKKANTIYKNAINEIDKGKKKKPMTDQQIFNNLMKFTKSYGGGK